MISFQKSIIFWSRWLYIICSCIEVTWIWLLSPSIWVYKATPWRVFINFRANTSNSMQFNISRFNSWKIIDESVKTWMVKIKRNVKYLNNRKRSFQSSPFESVHLKQPSYFSLTKQTWKPENNLFLERYFVSILLWLEFRIKKFYWVCNAFLTKSTIKLKVS